VVATSISALQAAASRNNVRIVIPASFGTQSGSVTVSGTHVDVVMSNAAQINGSVTFSNSVQRWSGGNVTGGWRASGYPITDITWNDVNVINRSDNVVLSAVSARIAILNSTFHTDQGGGKWALYSSSQQRRSDLILANVKQTGSPGDQTQRIQNWDRVVMVDGANNPRGEGFGGSTQSFRMHYNCRDVYIADYIIGPGGFTIAGVGTTVNIGASNIILERVTSYSSLTQMVVDSQLGSGTNIQRGTILYSSRASSEGPQNTSAGFSNGGGNIIRPWDGSAPPDQPGIGARR
jgi:hypothetical protein